MKTVDLYKQTTTVCQWLCFFAIFSMTCVYAEEKPALLLAKNYQQGIDLENYWISEKYDGFRAYWDGRQLISRQGHPFSAPAWFITNFPDQPLDGELWIAHQSFEQLASVVRQKKPHQGWKQVKYLVFDAPSSPLTFSQRLVQLEGIVSSANSSYLALIPQFKLATHESLMEELQIRVDAGAEGLMLHRGHSYYNEGRSSDLLKLKPLQDAEAKVVQHLAGKGKYQSLMGALLIELPSGLTFKIGTGFSDAERAAPPEVGSIVTFQYTGLTQRGVPRFARFLKERAELDWEDVKKNTTNL